jgi:hypothetical protein
MVFASTVTFCTGNGDGKASCLWRYRKLKDRRTVLTRWRHDAGVACSGRRRDTIMQGAGRQRHTVTARYVHHASLLSQTFNFLSHKRIKTPCFFFLPWCYKCYILLLELVDAASSVDYMWGGGGRGIFDIVVQEWIDSVVVGKWKAFGWPRTVFQYYNLLINVLI